MNSWCCSRKWLGRRMSPSLREVLAEVSKPHPLDHQDLQVTVSMGIGVYPADGTDAETLLKHADMALLYAKTQGRSNHQFFQPDMNMRAVARVF